VTQKLKTGDYTLCGYENILCIERKGSISEFARNVNQKRFERELIRMREFEYRFLILEFDMHHIAYFPAQSGIPERLWDTLKVTNKYILRRVIEITIEHNIHILFVGKFGLQTATSIFKRVFYAKSHQRRVIRK
jgi:hypothetical protein